MTLEIERVGAPRPPKNALAIPEGTVFEGKIGAHEGVFFKTQYVIVQLNHNLMWWSQSVLQETVVYNYHPYRAVLRLYEEPEDGV